MKITVCFDGGSKGNPGPAAGAAVLLDASGVEIETLGEYLPHATNNVAEWTGALIGLRRARELGATEVKLVGDSKLVVEQAAGRWQVKQPHLKPFVAEIEVHKKAGIRIETAWVPRDRNGRADEVANEHIRLGRASRRS